MNACAHPAYALRPLLPADTALLATIFRASIAELAADDYDEAQREAWAAAADDAAAFGARLARALTLVATVQGSPIGFIALEDGEHIAMLYVHPAVAGQGVGAMLCDAIEKLAASRGAARLTVDASETARPFFAKRGYVGQQRNTVLLGDEWLANTTMEKRFAPREATRSIS